MNYKLMPMVLLAMLLLMVPSAMAAAFAITQPDGTTDSTSDLFTLQWTPSLGAGTAQDVMLKDVNTISCWATHATGAAGNPVVKIYTAATNTPCCDKNKLVISTASWDGRLRGRTYYLYCQVDQNTDINAYSPGALTVTQFVAKDLGGLAVDVPGGLIGGLVGNIGSVAVLVVVAIIIILVVDLLTGVFGIISYFKRIAG